MNSFADLIRVRNIHTGQIGRVARSVFENPRINPGILVEADDFAKPYLPGLYRSKYNLPQEEAVEDTPEVEESTEDPITTTSEDED